MSRIKNLHEDIIYMLKIIYGNDIKGMKEFVETNLKVSKVQNCIDVETLENSFENLYKIYESSCIMNE